MGVIVSKAETTILSLKKQKGQSKFACLTAYDASFARVAANSGVQVLLVGDSLGMVLQGLDSTLPVSMEDIVYHTRCVARGNALADTPAFVMADLPFMSYATQEQGLSNAKLLMQAGANMVKLEGGAELCPLVERLSQLGVPVCAHLGLTPQSVNKLGGFKVQGRDEVKAKMMLEQAIALQESGADFVLLECVPQTLATQITQALDIPVIGIGAGVDTDAQILVMHDILGVSTGYTPKFSKNFLLQQSSIQDAFKDYADAVKSGAFPTQEQVFN